jgi:hypothetical protein
MTDGPTDKGMELCGVLESEDELQEWLEAAFEDAGWTAIREVSPVRSNYRADLIVQHDDYGWLGIETKYIGSSQGPIDMAEAHYQIVGKYRGRKYINNRIDLWLVCPYIKYGEDTVDPEKRWRREKWAQIYHMRQFFQHAGIGWIDLDHYSLDLDFIEADSAGTIPVGKLANSEKVRRNRRRYAQYTDKRAQNVDITRIREWAAGKVKNAPYGRPHSVREAAEVDADD